ncbi:MAG TPA: SIMPL domain-containing protein [Gemmatimonadaceae bacterium]
MTLRYAIALSLLGAAPLVAQLPAGGPPTPTPSISVSASGEVKVTPDRAYVTVGVMTRGATAAAAGAENARKQQAILDTLRKMGFTPQQLTTSGYNVSPDMRYNQQTGESTITGYSVRNSVRVEVRQIAQVGPVIDAALKKGSNEIQGVAFFSSQADSARREALKEAVALSRADAEVLAQAAGGSLGELLEMSTAQNPGRPVMYAESMALRGKADAATPVEPGEQAIGAFVTARWRFIPR